MGAGHEVGAMGYNLSHWYPTNSMIPVSHIHCEKVPAQPCKPSISIFKLKTHKRKGAGISQEKIIHAPPGHKGPETNRRWVVPANS